MISYDVKIPFFQKSVDQLRADGGLIVAQPSMNNDPCGLEEVEIGEPNIACSYVLPNDGVGPSVQQKIHITSGVEFGIGSIAVRLYVFQ